MATKGTLLYGAESKGGSSEASEFITRLLHASTAIHMHHLMVDGPGSYAAHTALGMYSDLADLADGLAESWMGCTGQKLTFGGGSFAIASSPIAEVQGLYDYVESKRGMMGSESHIQNDIDGICTLLSSTLYKLNRLA
jgi:hypothetical protein